MDHLENTKRVFDYYYLVTIDANGRRSSPLPQLANIRDEMQALLSRQPIKMTASEVTRTSSTLQWDLDSAGTEPSSYEIVQGGNVIDQTSGNTYTVTELQAGTYYNYRVVSISDDGLRSWDSWSRSVTVLTAGGPFAPATVDAFAYGPSTVEVIWPRAEYETTYASEYDLE